jgi:hypothetical protein
MCVISHAANPRHALAAVVCPTCGGPSSYVPGRVVRGAVPDSQSSYAAHGFAFSTLPTDQPLQSSEMIVAVIVGSLLFYSIWSFVALEINYRRAASMKIPLVRLPIDPLNILFQVFESHVWKIIDQLPVSSLLPNWTRYARRGWYFKDKAGSHLRYGPIWALVTPCDIHILVCDPEAVHEVFARRNDFIRPNKMYSEC